MEGQRLWVRWTVANGVGELFGLGTVFAVGFLAMTTLGEPRGARGLVVLAAVVIGLAILEGAVVGLAQWVVLREPLPAVTARAWIVATIVGAVVAWALGMIPSTLGSSSQGVSASPPPEPSSAILFGLAAGMGAVAGVILATAQWWVLRRHVGSAGLWLAGNAIAWGVAMPMIFWLVGATIGERQTLASVALLVLGIGLAGLVVGAIHGLFLLRILGRDNSR